MDFSIQIDTIKIGLSIIIFEGVTGRNLQIMLYLYPEDCFYLNTWYKRV